MEENQPNSSLKRVRQFPESMWERHLRLRKWHEYFAIFPVRLGDGYWRWLCKIRRRYIFGLNNTIQYIEYLDINEKIPEDKIEKRPPPPLKK